MSFAKMHGLGNDFMVIDGISQNVFLTEGQIRKLSNRHTGIGFDQLLLIEAPPQPDVDFHYRIYNADGSEVAQCGNGVRCLAKFVRKMGLTWKKKIRVSTMNGIMDLVLMRNGLVSVDMGVPQLAPDKIPLKAEIQSVDYQIQLKTSEISFGSVSMGNPHCVVSVDDVDLAEVDDIGQEINQHSDFPEGVNVGFMQVISTNEVKLRVFERGSGETQACGSGACASMVVGRLQNRLQQRAKVFLTGGHLHIDWEGVGKSLKMIGPAEFVYHGYIEV
ncbi:MAG: diaminopimelate epimerase [Enterobacterales bacterium]|nr:diaminopimelate epimerase [Enterobacterales bacterium]